MRLYRQLRSFRQLSIIAFSLSLIGACAVIPLTVDTKATAPVLDSFGATTLVASRATEPAQRLFAQGMAQVYAFNGQEAIRAFKAALAQDPECAMCAWGVALEMGPNINNAKRGDLKTAVKYVDYALAHSAGSSARDLALIGSLALRYGHRAGNVIAPPPGELCTAASGADNDPADPLDVAYARHLRTLVEHFPADPDVLALYAEAELVATRGDWWDRVTGKPGGRVGELATMIEAGLARQPNHVGLNHYMIHVVDAVPVAARALAAADRLGALAPKSPHLLHMPSHTYANLGRYADATRVNQLAVEADRDLVTVLKKQNFTGTVDWRQHDGHFQWYAALMEGRAELALESARASARRATGDNEYHEYMRSLPLLTLLQLQRWDLLITEPIASGEKGMAGVLGEMTHGIALARSGKLVDAKAALERLTPKAALMVAKQTGKGFTARMVRSIAASSQSQLEAEIAFAEHRTDEAVKLQAAAADSAVNAERTEPPMLAGGPRQRLGSMQLRNQQFAAAEQSFRADLALHPANGWALSGLEKALAGQGKEAAAKAAARDLAASWLLAESQVRATQ